MKQIIGYTVSFKNREETPIRLSVEGGEQLKEILMSESPPLFIPIKDRFISRNSIEQIGPIYKPTTV